MIASLAQNPAQAIVLTLAAMLVWGVAAQFLARKTRLPAILYLLAGGLLLGEAGLGWLSPAPFGDGKRALVYLAVAVIVFEGAFHLDPAELRRAARSVGLLITAGALVTCGLAGAVAHWLMGVPWPVGLLYGAIVSVTGPTVIAPIVRRLPVPQQVRTILEAESVLVDAVGVLLTGAVFACLTGAAHGLGGGALHFLAHLVVGLVAGSLGAAALSFSLRLSRTVTPDLARFATLAAALATYTVSEALAPQSGITAAAVAGLALGRLGLPHHEAVKVYKGDLVMLSLTIVFMLVATGLRPAEVLQLGWPGLAVVGLLMAVIRPLGVLVSTAGSALTPGERGFVAWLGPRGIVAASLGALMSVELATHRVPGGEVVGPLVLLTIGVTVLVQGGGAGWAARRLGILAPPEGA